jgi:hypothetical protein
VASTTLGEAEFSSVRARIVGDGLGAGGPEAEGLWATYRLVVQSYTRASLGEAHRPSGRAKPLGSLQRTITADELVRGVNVNLLHLGPGHGEEAPVVVAWVEPGAPDLEFDGLRARPSPDALYGAAAAGQERGATVVLKRRAA